MIQKVQGQTPEDERKPKRSLTEFEAAQTPAALREERAQSRRVVKPGAQRSTLRKEKADVSGSRGNGAGRA